MNYTLRIRGVVGMAANARLCEVRSILQNRRYLVFQFSKNKTKILQND